MSIEAVARLNTAVKANRLIKANIGALRTGLERRALRDRRGGHAPRLTIGLAEAVDPRLASPEDEVDTLGGLVFLLAGHIPARGECVIHPSGWRLEAVDSDPRRILRVRLHAPERST